MPSFDVVSKVDLQEVDNAVNQSRKEYATRYDFQGSNVELTLAPDKLSLVLKGPDKGKLDTAYEILLGKLSKRGVSLRSLKAGEIEGIGMNRVQKSVTLQQGITVEKSKELAKLLKDSKLKVQGSIQGEQLRVTGKNKDDLQAAIALLKSKQGELEVDLQFTNFRD